MNQVEHFLNYQFTCLEELISVWPVEISENIGTFPDEVVVELQTLGSDQSALKSQLHYILSVW